MGGCKLCFNELSHYYSPIALLSTQVQYFIVALIVRNISQLQNQPLCQITLKLPEVNIVILLSVTWGYTLALQSFKLHVIKFVWRALTFFNSMQPHPGRNKFWFLWKTMIYVSFVPLHLIILIAEILCSMYVPLMKWQGLMTVVFSAFFSFWWLCHSEHPTICWVSDWRRC